ncbi:GNAT family N-acetyltransferase [Nonomuraea sp. NPDC050790]|uniref:GNAT family N-acetyltransferase n=1 Tax=Nonomuraea sp. NPDC050790 TaxID=3364371 RepID=UPI003791124A
MEIVGAGRADGMEEVGELLGRAFAGDPVIEWMLPEAAARPGMFAALAHYMHDVVDVARDEGGAVVGAALWDPPGFAPDLAEGGPALLAAMGDRVAYGMLLDETFARHRPREPHWYLAQIGTDPAVQGTGVGAALLRKGLARCAGLPVYLESSKESNIPVYEHFGFRVTTEIKLPDGPAVWGMLRPAVL